MHSSRHTARAYSTLLQLKGLVFLLAHRRGMNRSLLPAGSPLADAASCITFCVSTETHIVRRFTQFHAQHKVTISTNKHLLASNSLRICVRRNQGRPRQRCPKLRHAAAILNTALYGMRRSGQLSATGTIYVSPNPKTGRPICQRSRRTPPPQLGPLRQLRADWRGGRRSGAFRSYQPRMSQLCCECCNS